jgi:hypothetical protein
VDDLVAFRSLEELLQPFAHAAHEVLHGCLPVGGAQQVPAGGDEGIDLLRPDLGRTGPEAAVLG